MNVPWTVEAVQVALVERPHDRRLQEALCIIQTMSCACEGRQSISDCEACGLDIPPGRNVFTMRRRTIWDRPPS